MRPKRPSLINRRYLIGLEAPQEVCRMVEENLSQWTAAGCIPSPFAPMLPLGDFSSAPKPPVPGLLPPCDTTIGFGESLRMDHSGSWWIWPVEAGSWPQRLWESLSAGKEIVDSLYPPLQGIPLAARTEVLTESATGAAGIIFDKTSGWRALKLICLEVEYLSVDDWYANLRWRKIWERRLRRAPPAD